MTNKHCPRLLFTKILNWTYKRFMCGKIQCKENNINSNVQSMESRKHFIYVNAVMDLHQIGEIAYHDNQSGALR